MPEVTWEVHIDALPENQCFEIKGSKDDKISIKFYSVIAYGLSHEAINIESIGKNVIEVLGKLHKKLGYNNYKNKLKKFEGLTLQEIRRDENSRYIFLQVKEKEGE